MSGSSVDKLISTLSMLSKSGGRVELSMLDPSYVTCSDESRKIRIIVATNDFYAKVHS